MTRVRRIGVLRSVVAAVSGLRHDTVLFDWLLVGCGSTVVVNTLWDRAPGLRSQVRVAVVVAIIEHQGLLALAVNLFGLDLQRRLGLRRSQIFDPRITLPRQSARGPRQCRDAARFRGFGDHGRGLFVDVEKDVGNLPALVQQIFAKLVGDARRVLWRKGVLADARRHVMKAVRGGLGQGWVGSGHLREPVRRGDVLGLAPVVVVSRNTGGDRRRRRVQRRVGLVEQVGQRAIEFALAGAPAGSVARSWQRAQRRVRRHRDGFEVGRRRRTALQAKIRLGQLPRRFLARRDRRRHDPTHGVARVGTLWEGRESEFFGGQVAALGQADDAFQRFGDGADRQEEWLERRRLDNGSAVIHQQDQGRAWAHGDGQQHAVSGRMQAERHVERLELALAGRTLVVRISAAHPVDGAVAADAQPHLAQLGGLHARAGSSVALQPSTRTDQEHSAAREARGVAQQDCQDHVTDVAVIEVITELLEAPAKTQRVLPPRRGRPHRRRAQVAGPAHRELGGVSLQETPQALGQRHVEEFVQRLPEPELRRDVEHELEASRVPQLRLDGGRQWVQHQDVGRPVGV